MNDNNNNFDNNWSSMPNSNSDNTAGTNQQNTDSFGQNNNGWNSNQQSNNSFNTTNQNNFDNGWGTNQASSNTSAPYDNSYTQNTNSSGGFDSNVNYSNNTGFNPNQTYQNSLNGMADNNTYFETPMNFGYTPVENSVESVSGVVPEATSQAVTMEPQNKTIPTKATKQLIIPITSETVAFDLMVSSSKLPYILCVLFTC